MKKEILKSMDGYPLNLNVFECDNPVAIIQIVHGMEEHKERYTNFAEFLLSNGFNVVVSNLRGHGRDAENLGFFADKKGYELLIEDQKIITNWIKNTYRNKKVYLFAHSMGTIIARNLLKTDSSLYNKVILSGYPPFQSSAYIGIVLSNIIRTFRGNKYKSKLLEKLSVGRFSNKIKNAKTSFDWICSNQKVVDKYNKDVYCGNMFTCSAYNDLYHLVVGLKSNKYRNIYHDLQILLLNGQDDPCVCGNRGLNKSLKYLNRDGFNLIKKISYESKRHELINEIDNTKVYKDILEFLNK